MDDRAIIKHLERKYNLVVSCNVVEVILQAIACREHYPIFEDMLEIKGREPTLDIPQVILVPVEEFLVNENLIFH